MENKKEALAMVQAARSAHIQWRARAQALVAGIPVAKEQIPVTYTDCKFGKWYYGSGQTLSEFASYRAVEEPHEQLHMVYMQIFNLLFGEDHRAFMTKLFSSKRKHDEKKQEEAEKALENLIGISHTLLETIELLEKDIRNLPD